MLLEDDLAQSGARTLRRGGRVVQFVCQTGRQLAERGHLLKVARQLLSFESCVFLGQLAGTNSLADVTEETVRRDNRPVKRANGNAPFDRNWRAVLGHEDRVGVLQLLTAEDAHEESLAMFEGRGVDDAPDVEAGNFLSGVAQRI